MQSGSCPLPVLRTPAALLQAMCQLYVLCALPLAGFPPVTISWWGPVEDVQGTFAVTGAVLGVIVIETIGESGLPGPALPAPAKALHPARHTCCAQRMP